MARLAFAFAAFAVAFAVSVHAGLSPISSIDSSVLQTSRVPVDWVVAIEYDPTTSSTNFASQLTALLQEAATGMFRTASSGATARFGFVVNSQSPSTSGNYLPLTNVTADINAAIGDISFSSNPNYVPSYDSGLLAANAIFDASTSPIFGAATRRVITLITNGASSTDGLSTARAIKYRGTTITTFGFVDPNAAVALSVHDFERLSTERSGSVTYNVLVKPLLSAPTAGAYQAYRSALVMLMARVRNDPGWMCSAFGAGSIITFDSNTYNFQGLGNYWLATSLNPMKPYSYLAVEVRKSVCGPIFGGSNPNGNAGATDSGSGSVTAPHATCARDFAFTDGTDTFNFLSQATATTRSFGNTLAASVVVTVVVNNVTLTSAGPSGRTYWQWTSNGGTSSLLMRTRGRRVMATVVLRNGTVFELQFAATGGSIGITPSTASYGTLGGLCGLYDGLAFNDFTSATGVFTASGADGETLASVFSESWRVQRGYSLFYTSAINGLTGQRRVSDQSFPINWSGDYSMPSSTPAECGSAGVPSSTTAVYDSESTFFSDACSYDVGMGGDASAAKFAFESQCHMYCTFGHFPNLLLNATDCSSMCSFDDSSSKLDLHVRYNNNLLPTVSLSGLDQPRILFAPEQAFGGAFGVQLTVNDRCGTYTSNVTVNIVCVNPPTLSAVVSDPPSPIRVGTYGWPDVFLTGTATSALPLAYSWKFLSTPAIVGTTNPVLYVPNPSLFPNSRSPQVYFAPQYAGDYIVEFAVADGCAIERYNLTVSVECGACGPAPAVAPLQPILWNGNPANFGPVGTGNSVPLIGDYSTDFDIGLAYQSPLPSFVWNFTTTQPNVVMSSTALGGSNVVVFSTVPGHYSVVNMQYATQTVPFMPVVTTQSPLSVSAVQSLYEATASFTVVGSAIVQTNTTTITTPTPQPYCVFTIASYANVDASLQVAPWPGKLPNACIGVYNLTLTTRDECSVRWDDVPVDVQCSTPVARIKCHSAHQTYNWQSMSFGPLYFDGRDSYDPSGDRSGLVYDVTDTYQWTAVGPEWCGDGVQTCSLGTATTASGTPVRGGQPVVQLTTSNGCLTSTDTITVNLDCAGAYLPKVSVNTKDGTVSAILSTIPLYGVFQSFTWKVIGSSATYPVDSSFTPPTFVTTSLYNATFSGAYVAGGTGGSAVYDVSVLGDGGCQTSSAGFTIQINCDTAINIHASGVGTMGLQYTAIFVPGAGGTGSFQAITADASSTTANSANWFPTPVPLQFHWQYQPTAIQPQNLPIATPGASISSIGPFQPPTVGTSTIYNIQIAVHDPCVWQTAVVQVLCACLQTPTISGSASSQPNPANAYNQYFTLSASTNSGSEGASVLSWQWTPVTRPAGSNFLNTPGQTQTINFAPDRAGHYVALVTVSDGCWTATATVPFDVECIQFTVSIPPPLAVQTVQWNDKQTANLNGDGSTWPGGYTKDSFVYQWSIASAPAASVYAVYNLTTITTSYVVSTGQPVAGPINTTVTITNVTTVNVTNWARTVALQPVMIPGPNPEDVWPVCFRPDIGGVYHVLLSVNPLGAPDCVVTQMAVITNNCSAPPIGVVANANSTVTVSRARVTHLLLDATASRDPEGMPLTFWWQQVSGPALVGGVIHNANTSLASFIPSQTGESYGFVLIVSDGCSNTTVWVWFFAACGTNMPTQNDAVYAYYDGELPVPYMALGYDYSATLGVINPTDDQATYGTDSAQCQSYSWALVSYSSTVQPAPEPGPSEPITKSAAFIAGMTIACLVLVGGGGYFGYRKYKQNQAGHGNANADAAPAGANASPNAAAAAPSSGGAAVRADADAGYQPPVLPSQPAPTQAVASSNAAAAPVAMDARSAAAPTAAPAVVANASDATSGGAGDAVPGTGASADHVYVKLEN